MTSKSRTAIRALLSLACLGIFGLGMFLLFSARNSRPVSAPEPQTEAVQTQSQPTRAPASLPKPGAARTSSLTSSPPPNSEKFHSDFFRRELAHIPIVTEIYDGLKAKLPPGEASELVEVYISEGPVRQGGPEFAKFMSSLHEDIRAHSAEIADLLKKQDAALKQDPFVYQMTLNLAFQLNLPPEGKAEVLGNAMSIHFAKDKEGGVSLMSANITNALILMKNSGVTMEQALPYIRKGLATNFDDPEALREYIARVNAYYPGAI